MLTMYIFSASQRFKNKTAQSNLGTGRVATPGRPHAPLQTAVPTIHALSHIYTPQTLVTKGRLTFAPKITPTR